MQIRRAIASDRSEWLRMRSALWPHARLEHSREIEIYLDASPGESAVFVAERPSGSGLAGLLEARLRSHADGCTSSPVVYIEGWYVDPDVRRAGLARRLLEAAEAWGRDLGVTEMASDADIDSRRARRVHAAVGFEQVGRVMQYRRRLEGGRLGPGYRD